MAARQYFNPRSLAGATAWPAYELQLEQHFNPRSLAGATDLYWPTFAFLGISILAPSRERQKLAAMKAIFGQISILAPSRERLCLAMAQVIYKLFQFSLPRGSDLLWFTYRHTKLDFNPRSLAGATDSCAYVARYVTISILAPSRERPASACRLPSCTRYFNPRSLAGATITLVVILRIFLFQSTLPRGSDKYWRYSKDFYIISIHAPSRERHNIGISRC